MPVVFMNGLITVGDTLNRKNCGGQDWFEIPQQRQEVIVKIFSGASYTGFSPGYRIKTISLPCGFLVMACKKNSD